MECRLEQARSTYASVSLVISSVLLSSYTRSIMNPQCHKCKKATTEDDKLSFLDKVNHKLELILSTRF